MARDNNQSAETAATTAREVYRQARDQAALQTQYDLQGGLERLTDWMLQDEPDSMRSSGTGAANPGPTSRVSWSDQAEAELEALVPDPAVREQLKRNAEATLHHVVTYTPHEGAEDGIMWHRGITHEQERQIETGSLPEDDDGTQCWDYFLFYRPLDSAGFEVIGLRSTHQIAALEEIAARASHARR